MDGTPKAKLRRQSLPSQHYLSPSGLQDEATEYNERLRFRDEMGIDAQSSYANPQQAYNAHMSDPALFLHGHGKQQNSSFATTSGRGNLPMKVEDQDVGFSTMQGTSMTAVGGSADAGAKKKVRKKWTIEETKMLVDGCNKVSWFKQTPIMTC